MTVVRIVADDGVQLAVEVFPNPAARVRLVVSHGNGLAARGYRVFWEPLCRHHEVVLFDLRGHGLSERGDAEHHTWIQFARDFESLASALVKPLGARVTVGALHSLSAVASLLHLHESGPRWDGLVLFDPSLPPPVDHALEPVHRDEMASLAERSLRRRLRFDDPAELAARFARSELFGAWRARAPLDMALATLREDAAAGNWTLACEPKREASIYTTNAGHPVWQVLRERPCPIHIVAGDPQRPGAGVPCRASKAAHEDTGVSYESIEGARHFLQLEQPERCREALLRFLATLG